MITLLTGQPGNGKTSKIINEIKKHIAEGRTVYTCGIPKLNLPVIELTRSQVALWHERTEVLPAEKTFVIDTYVPKVKHNYQLAITSTELALTPNFLEAYHRSDEVEPVFVLNNIVEGSVIFVDEAQKGFQPTGVKIPEHIDYLTEHRHHGLDFVFITQYPFLVHQTVRALITIHWHIRFTWKGRKIHEWPEWQERPQSQAAIGLSATSPYKIDKSTYEHYDSASIHTVVKHKTPMYFYFGMCVFVAIPIMLYLTIHRIYDRTQKHNISPISVTQASTEKAKLLPESHSTPQTAPSAAVSSFENVQIVSNQYDWSKIAACVDFKGQCRCYGDSAERLVVPETVCKAAVTSGWSGRPIPPPVDAARHTDGSTEKATSSHAEQI